MALRSIASLEPAAGHPHAELRALLRARPPAGVVTIGTFDGVHAGHRALIARAASEAKAHSTRLGAITFSPRPDTVVSSQPALPDICTLEQRIRRLHWAGADDVIVVPFTRSLMQITAREFVGCVIEELGVHALVVGEEFALGRGREGTVTALRQLGLNVVALPVLRLPGQHAKISSSTIRRTIAAGTSAALALT